MTEKKDDVDKLIQLTALLSCHPEMTELEHAFHVVASRIREDLKAYAESAKELARFKEDFFYCQTCGLPMIKTGFSNCQYCSEHTPESTRA